MRRLCLIALLLVMCAAGTPAAAAPGDLTTLYGVPDLNGNSPLHAPRGVAEARDGSILVADTENHRVLRVTRDGVATTIAGILDQPGFSGDGGPATQATLRYPRGVAALADGSFLIADSDNYRVRRVSRAGVITTVAGGGEVTDGSDPRRVRLGWPESVVAAPGGGFLIVESSAVGQIRRVLPNGTITRVAGGGPDEDSEGIPATAARFSSPTDASFTRDGGILVTDSVNNRIRLVAPNGTITTVAGIGYQGTGATGDGGPATAAQIGRPHAVAASSDGGFLIAQELDHRIRQVSPGGTITTLAGGPARGSVSYPHDLILLARGGGVVADTGHDLVSLLETDLRPASPRAATGPPRCTAGPVGLAITGWTRPRFRSLLGGAWRVFVTAPAAGRISTRLAARGRTLARRTAIVRQAEPTTVRLRRVRGSRAVVRGHRALRARVTVRFRSKASKGSVQCAVRFRR